MTNQSTTGRPSNANRYAFARANDFSHKFEVHLNNPDFGFSRVFSHLAPVYAPVMVDKIDLTFGQFMQDLADLAKKYRCHVRESEESLKSLKITGEMAYIMSVYMIESSAGQHREMKPLLELKHLVADLYSNLKSYAEFDREPRTVRNFNDNFVYTAMCEFRRQGNDLSKFDEEKAKSNASKFASRLAIDFTPELGQMYQCLLVESSFIKGSAEGARQSAKLLPKVDVDPQL